MKRWVLFACALLGPFPVSGWAAGQDPFHPVAAVEQRAGRALVSVRFTVPPAHILYADELKISAEGGVKLEAVDPPQPKTIHDKFSEEDKRVFDSDVEFVFALAEPAPPAVTLLVSYQGCDDQVCFFPQERTFTLAVSGAGPAEEVPTTGIAGAESSNDWKSALRDFTPVSTAAGYLNRQQFLDFLNAGAGAGDTSLADFRRRGLLLTVALLLVGGLALNLTPCVLPLIPINLAILGAGAQARSKGQGFLLGGLYGLAMAITYGTLGLLVVFTGAKFGALNASLGFNIAIAVLFVALALAMFDVIAIDLSRFQSTAGAQGRTGAARYAAAFAMGAVAALLAGACVAPVVISTLLLAGNLYAQGEKAAALLPFLLGLGMGLPWPFAGAGLSFLPKPGKWMTWVKYAFGVMILGLAAYYGKIAWDIYSLQRAQAGTGGGGDPATASTEKFVAALQAAAREGKPVFIDFWATWCKNCHAMEATTFKDAAVRERLKDFIVVKYQAEFPSRSPAKDVLENFGAIGLPTYVVLKPGAVR